MLEYEVNQQNAIFIFSFLMLHFKKIPVAYSVQLLAKGCQCNGRYC